MKFGLRILTAGALALCALAGYTADLSIGSTAPPLKIAKWIKGNPIAKFEKGKVYVVEFWATWCGPCKASIPHLTEMAKKYAGKATFTGVSVYEVPKAQWHKDVHAKVASFVKDMGAKMDYNVAADGEDGVMADTWMKAAGQGGIPTAFVVNQDSKVVWIGHPMVGLDEVVGKVIEGKFDVKAAKAQFEKEQAEAKLEAEKMKKRNAALQPYAEAMRAGKYADAIAVLDKVMGSDPEMATQAALLKFNALLQSDERAAMAWADEAAKGIAKDDPMVLNQMAWTIVDDQSKLKKPDFAVAIRVAQQGLAAAGGEDPMVLDTLAFAYFKNNELEKAIETQEKAVAKLDGNAAMDEEMKKEIRDRLAMFKAKKKGL